MGNGQEPEGSCWEISQAGMEGREAVPVVDCTKALKRKVQRSVDLFLGKESH